MGKFLLGFASVCIGGPLVAALFEPIFFGAAKGIGWGASDVEKASEMVTSYIFGEFLVASVAIMTFGMGVWVHWLVGKPRRKAKENVSHGPAGGVFVGHNLTANAPVAIGNHNTIVENDNRIFAASEVGMLASILPKAKPVDFKILSGDGEAENFASQIYFALKKEGYKFCYETFVQSNDFSGGGGRIGISVEDDFSLILIGGKDSPVGDFRVGLGGMMIRNVSFE